LEKLGFEGGLFKLNLSSKSAYRLSIPDLQVPLKKIIILHIYIKIKKIGNENTNLTHLHSLRINLKISLSYLFSRRELNDLFDGVNTLTLSRNKKHLPYFLSVLLPSFES